MADRCRKRATQPGTAPRPSSAMPIGRARCASSGARTSAIGASRSTASRCPARRRDAELVEATIARAEKVLPDIGPDRPGIGFVIAHDAAAIGIALIYWWAAANELHQRVFTSPIEKPAALEPVPHPAAGCVWELGIIDFERRAWIEDVLKKGDIELYLGRELRTEV